MIRWLIAAVLVVLAVAALWPIAGHPGDPEGPAAPRDILGYELDPSRPLEVEVPAPIEALYISTWAVLDDPACEPTDRYAYGIVISFIDEDGRDVGVRDFDLVSRRDCDGEPNTRLADSPEPVADHRTLVLRTADILPRGGRMRLFARPGLTKAVIAMIEARYRRDPYGQSARELAFTPQDRRRIAGRITSLGYADLPPSARSEIAGAWSRRVDASGIDGRDYFLRRLMIRDFTTPLPASESPPVGFPISARHFAAYNLDGALDLDLAGPPGARVKVRDPRGSGADLTLSAEGAARVSLPDGPLRTVVLEGEGHDEHVQTIVSSLPSALKQIGDVRRRPVAGGRVELVPDLRLVKHSALDPVRPVIAHIADGGVLRVEVRAAFAENDPAESITIPIQVTWGAGSDQRLAQNVTLPRSRFERWGDGTDASDRVKLLVRPATSDGAALITGDPAGRVVLKVLDPHVEDLLALPYRVVLQPEEIWRYPPFDLRQWVPVLPENHEELREDGRWLELREQVRIEKPGAGEGAGALRGMRPERVLVPEENPVRRRFFAKTSLAAGEEMAGDVWSALSSAPRRLSIASEGPKARRLSLLYRAEATALGGVWNLRDGDAIIASAKINLTSGTHGMPLDPGAHLFKVDAPSDALFFIDAPPEVGGEVVRERTVFELTRAAPLDLRFPQRDGEPLTVVLFVITEGEAAPWSIRYRIDGGKPAALVGRFFHTLTVPSGTLAGDGSGATRGWLWESKLSGVTPRDAMTKARIPIGDDLVPGRRTVHIELAESRAPVWIAAVLYGQAAPSSAPGSSMWVEVPE